jgi:predicted ABC-class ATPase
MERLRQQLKQIDGRGYKAYKQLQGSYDFNHFQLTIDHVQGDPFALPSRISLQLTPQQHGLSTSLWHNPIRQTALEDFLGRAVAGAIQRHVHGQRGTGRSGTMEIAVNGQQVLKRNAVLIEAQQLDVRLLFALPGSGRSVLAEQAAEMFFTELPRIVEEALVWNGPTDTEMERHIDSVEDQDQLRRQLDSLGAVAFLADGALLPRRSGIDDRPLAAGVPLRSPDELQSQVDLPHQGRLSGMLIPTGVTLVVGGGFHGKSTLLQALERGVYNHIPGDGREQVATVSSAVKIRAEDHRAIHQVDISPFINNLPGDRPTASFSTTNASGSTSQAANIIEALDCGCHCLLIDEDTAATNLMIRDQRMQQLVPDAHEPITPLLHRVRELYQQHNVSSIIVSGGSGDYLDVADRVLMLDHYRVFDVTAQARQLAAPPPTASAQSKPFFQRIIRRLNFPLKPLPRQREAKILVREGRLLEYGRQRIDLSQVEQLLDSGQTEAIGRLLAWCQQQDPQQPEGLMVTLRRALERAENQGLDILLPWKAGHLALPRLYELAAAANRLRQEQNGF